MSTARAALRWLDERRPGERTMLVYMPISGHHPYETPGEGPRPFGEATPLDSYKSDLFRGDVALGELIDGLKARGLFEETLFVIHGDHGEAFAQHEGNFAHSLHVYEENVRVPLFVVAPGIVTSRIRAPQPVTLLDVVPTMASLAGVPPSPLWEGRSALSGEPRVARFFADHTLTWLALRDGRWKLIHDADSGTSRLFDLSMDPEETVDLASREPARVHRYEEHLGKWSARQRALATRH
jgi:arylsulfatase A-like enzyme